MVDVINQVDEESIRKLAPYIDIWVPLTSQLYPQTEKAKKRLASFRKDKGAKVWAYDCATWMNVQSLMDYYRLKAWKAWDLGLDGIAYCTYYSPNGDPWDTLDRPDTLDEGMVYEGARNDILVAGKHWEAFRDGVEDYCYLHLLKQRIATAKGQGKSTRKAEQLLARCAKDVLSNTNSSGLIDNYRAKLAAEIIRLQK